MDILRYTNSLTFAADMKYLAEQGYDPYNSIDDLEKMLKEEQEFNNVDMDNEPEDGFLDSNSEDSEAFLDSDNYLGAY